MLSYIVRLAFEFQKNHGYWPNVLYLNQEQFQGWRREFPDTDAFNEVIRRLDLDLIISTDALHPHVAWLPNRRRLQHG